MGQNARCNGALSTHLVLDNETRDEFDLLLAAVQQDMVLVGLVEKVLVERVVATIWRQR